MLCVHYFLTKGKKLFGRPNTKIWALWKSCHRMPVRSGYPVTAFWAWDNIWLLSQWPAGCLSDVVILLPFYDPMTIRKVVWLPYRVSFDFPSTHRASGSHRLPSIVIDAYVSLSSRVLSLIISGSCSEPFRSFWRILGGLLSRVGYIDIDRWICVCNWYSYNF